MGASAPSFACSFTSLVASSSGSFPSPSTARGILLRCTSQLFQDARQPSGTETQIEGRHRRKTQARTRAHKRRSKAATAAAGPQTTQQARVGAGQRTCNGRDGRIDDVGATAPSPAPPRARGAAAPCSHQQSGRVERWNCGMAEPRVVTLTCTPSRILTKHGKKTNEHHQFLVLIVHFLIPTVHKRQGHKPHKPWR